MSDFDRALGNWASRSTTTVARVCGGCPLTPGAVGGRLPLCLMRRWLVLVGVLLVSSGAASASSSSAPRVSGYGIRFALPTGWSGHIRPLRGPPPIAVVVQAGSFNLPLGDDDAGTKARARMTAQSIFIVILEAGNGDAGFSYPMRTLPVSITRRDFLPMFEGVPSTHAFARTFFASHQRRFQVWVEFGAKRLSAASLRRANIALAGLRVSAIR